MYGKIFVGGTFDQFHAGHEAILLRTFQEGERVIIGLTSDAYIKKFKVGPHRPYQDRKETIENWLDTRELQPRATIIPIDDPYEPAASDADLNAIVVTKENKVRGDE